MVETTENNDRCQDQLLQVPKKSDDASTEIEVGIATFLAETHDKGDFITLNASFKHRFSDFIVNELDKETGEVVWYQSENANL
jgi:hypothetical protein